MADPSPVLIITRPGGAGQRFADRVRDAFGGPVDIILSPLMRIEPCATDLPDVAPSGVILTSANAVPAVARLGIPKGTVAWCVGSHTARAAQDAGLEIRDAGGDAEALLEMILAHRPAGRLLHLRGEVSRGDVADRLSAGGIPCDERVVYRQIAQDLSNRAKEALSGGRPVVIPLFSPRTADILCEQGPFRAPVHIIAMSGAVAARLDPLGVSGRAIVDRPDLEAMLMQTVTTLRKLSPGAA